MSPPPATLSSLSSLFPLTSPIPNPLSHPDILHPDSLTTEEDLLLNPENFKTWYSHITATKDRLAILEKAEIAAEEEKEGDDNVASVLGPLRSASPSFLPFHSMFHPSMLLPASTASEMLTPTLAHIYTGLRLLDSLFKRSPPSTSELFKSSQPRSSSGSPTSSCDSDTSSVLPFSRVRRKKTSPTSKK